MAHVALEYMIMIPLLILQIFIFPIAAVTIMNAWSDSRTTLQLQEISGHIGSSMQQLYYTLNHASISSGSITAELGVPTVISDGNVGHNYMIILTNATNPNSSVKVMNLTLSIIGAGGKASTLVTLGQNAFWQNNSTFRSNNISIINATKSTDSISLTFGGGS